MAFRSVIDELFQPTLDLTVYSPFICFSAVGLGQSVEHAIEPGFVGWTTVPWPNSSVKKGRIVFSPCRNNKVRVRQIKTFVPPLLATKTILPGALLKSRSECALKLFNMLTWTVFGRLSVEHDESSDLREHVVGLLFNLESSLSHLQVCRSLWL